MWEGPRQPESPKRCKSRRTWAITAPAREHCRFLKSANIRGDRELLYAQTHQQGWKRHECHGNRQALMKLNPCRGPPPTVPQPTSPRVTETNKTHSQKDACTHTCNCILMLCAWNEQRCTPVTRQQHSGSASGSRESCASRPSAGHSAGVCEQGVRGSPGAHFHLEHFLAIKSSRTKTKK